MSKTSSMMKAPGKTLLTTFYVGKEIFGLEVIRVQEVTGCHAIVPVPLAPEFV